MFAWWHRVRDGTLARSTFRRYMAPRAGPRRRLARRRLPLVLRQDAAHLPASAAEQPRALDLCLQRRHRADEQQRRERDPPRSHHPQDIVWLPIRTWLSLLGARAHGSRHAAPTRRVRPRLRHRCLSGAHDGAPGAVTARRVIMTRGVNGYLSFRHRVSKAQRVTLIILR